MSALLRHRSGAEKATNHPRSISHSRRFAKSDLCSCLCLWYLLGLYRLETDIDGCRDRCRGMSNMCLPDRRLLYGMDYRCLLRLRWDGNMSELQLKRSHWPECKWRRLEEMKRAYSTQCKVFVASKHVNVGEWWSIYRKSRVGFCTAPPLQTSVFQLLHPCNPLHTVDQPDAIRRLLSLPRALPTLRRK